MKDDIYGFEVKTIDGKLINLKDFERKILLIVNTASKCGFTPQYEGLQKLYEEYKEKGFEILAFPCNQFLDQEPGSENEILEFCSTKYNVTFPLFAKIEVNGKDSHPLYQFLKQKQSGIFGSKDIKWNFTKFLINRQGEVIKRFAPKTTPEAIKEHIEKL